MFFNEILIKQYAQDEQFPNRVLVFNFYVLLDYSLNANFTERQTSISDITTA